MATRIRLQRQGRKGLPFYRIAVFDSRTKRDGRYIEKLGHYDPLVKDESKRVVLDLERYKHWIEQGALETEATREIIRGSLKEAGLTPAVPGLGKRERRAKHRRKARAEAKGSK